MLFCAYLALQGLRWQTIKSYLSAVRHFQLMQGAPPGSLDGARPRLQLMLRGIKRATSTKPSKARLPITPFILRQVWRTANKNEPSQDTLMLWAAMNMCFFGFLQAGEVCTPSAVSYDPSWHLCVQDLALDSHINPSAHEAPPAQRRHVVEHPQPDQHRAVRARRRAAAAPGVLRASLECRPAGRGGARPGAGRPRIRRSRVTHRSRGAILFVTIKASKTDPFRQGSTVTLGKTDRLLCPISAILPYVAVRGSEAGPCSTSKMAHFSLVTHL